MNFKQIANRVTGFGFPLFSISWNPLPLEIDLAQRVITFLEDKRVLYNPYELEVPEHCKQSIIQIREFLTNELFSIKSDSELGLTLRTIRTACRKFLDASTFYSRQDQPLIYNQMGMGDQLRFNSGIGELRGVIGIQIAKLVVMHGLDCEGDLFSMLPLEVE